MRFWWVNQNQTYRHEVRGSYLWSPKRKVNQARNPYYDFMRELAPGDVVLSFADTLIRAIGRAVSHAYEAPKPLEYGQTGAYWERIGWRVDVRFAELQLPLKPAEHMDVLGPLLPARYAPLRANGAGLQQVYLTYLPDQLAAALVDLIGAEAHRLLSAHVASQELPLAPATGLAEWEEHALDEVRSDASLPETDRQALVVARRGQGLFKTRVMAIEHACRVTGVEQIEHLRASHCKPWRDASNAERLDGENGLLLTPSIDHLFDRGFIGFTDAGRLIISPVAHLESLQRMGIDPGRPPTPRAFSSGQRNYLAFHRESVLLHSSYLERL